MPNCSVFSCKKRSETSSVQKDNVTFHLFPKEVIIRDAWVRACGNHTSWSPKRTSTICSQHFEPSCFITLSNNKRRLKQCATPTLELPKEASSLTEDLQIKREFEDDFSEHEEDIEDKLNRKRQREADDQTDIAKRIKTESPEFEGTSEDFGPNTETEKEVAQSNVDKKSSRKPTLMAVDAAQHREVLTVEINRENDIFPVDFMRSVLSSQNEILTVLKSQVLLQDPKPDLLTFLRLIGAKLSRFSRERRNAIQNGIIDFIDNFPVLKRN